MSDDRRRTTDAGKEKRPSSYAGRWVARLRGKIIAQGGTPAQARHAAQGSRFKEVPEIAYMPTAEPLRLSPLLNTVLAALPSVQPLYLVGGSVRDALMGRLTHDLDFLVPTGALGVARRVAKALAAAFFPLDEERDTGRVIVMNADGTRDVLDFTSFRGADPSAGSGQALEADLLARDFTINAMAMDVRTQSLLDPLGGAADLREKRIRACAATTFSDDPVRILRAVRQAAAFGFHILPATRQAMRAAVDLLPKVSVERQRDELFRMLDGPQAAASLRALDLLEVLPRLLPELPALKGFAQPLPHVSDVWSHTLSVLQHLESILAALAPDYDPDKASDLFTGLLVLRLGRYRQQFAGHFAASLNPDRSLRALLFLAALYHDVAKPLSRASDENDRPRFWGHDEEGAEMATQRANALHLSNDEVSRLKTIIRNHMRVLFHTNRLIGEGKSPTRRAIYRFFRFTDQAGVDVILLALADLRATYEQTLPQETWAACLDVCRTFLENWWEKPQEVIAPPPLVNGKDLMRAFGLSQGPLIGQLLEAIREQQAMGKITSSEEALTFGRNWLAEQKPEETE